MTEKHRKVYLQKIQKVALKYLHMFAIETELKLPRTPQAFSDEEDMDNDGDVDGKDEDKEKPDGLDDDDGLGLDEETDNDDSGALEE